MKEAFIPVDFGVRTDIVVIGTDPEAADYDNPKGHIFGFSSYVVLSDEEGNTRLLHVATASCENEVTAPADKLATALEARWKNLGKLPVRFGEWSEGRPRYASAAYSAYGAEDDRAWERSTSWEQEVA